MIEKTIGWKVGGEVFVTLEAAQAAEIEAIFNEDKRPHWQVEDLANMIVSKQGRIIDVLTTTAKSRPRARKANGGTKSRKQIRKDVVAQFNEIAAESADAMRTKIAEGKAV